MIRSFAFCLCLAVLPACGSEPDEAAEPQAPAPAEPAAEADPTASSADTAAVPIILYLGDSLTAGYGLPQGQEQAFPALIQARLDTLGWGFRTVNAGVSGDTSAGGLRRIEWLLQRYRPDVFVLALGANDGLRGLPPEALRRNLVQIIEQVRTANPDARVVLLGMMVPTSMGGAYGQRFGAVYQDVAEATGAELVPFLLEGVGGRPELNQPDGVHPTAEGQRIMAETVWATLQPVLEEVRQEA